MVYLVVFIIALVVALCLAPKAPDAVPASLADLDVPTAEPGRPIPVVFGTAVVKSANVVWYGDLSYIPIKTKSGK